MANPVTHQIRDAIATLVTSLTTTGTRVYKSWPYPLADTHLPGLVVRLGNMERDEEEGTLGGLGTYDLDVMIEARAKPAPATNVAEQLDKIISEVGAAIAADRHLGTLNIAFCRLDGIPEPEITGNLEHPAGIVRMPWHCRFQMNEADLTVLPFAS